ncbi:MAG: hypothetical protein HXK63_04650, partial [Campylobacter sp.]|nr:hypothetical protein [Campylobacter sp.]
MNFKLRYPYSKKGAKLNVLKISRNDMKVIKRNGRTEELDVSKIKKYTSE